MNVNLIQVVKAIFTLPITVVQLIIGHRPDPGPMPTAQAEEALALVTNFHHFKLDHVDMECNIWNFDSIYNNQDIDNLENDLNWLQNQINQMLESGQIHHDVKRALRINQQLNQAQVEEYQNALMFGPYSNQVQAYRLLYKDLSQTHGVAPLERHHHSTLNFPIFDIPEKTPFGDTGDLERLLNAMQYNVQLATRERLQREELSRRLNSAYATDEGERRVAQAEQSGDRLAYHVWAQATQQERARQPGIQVPEVLLKPFRLIKRLVQKLFRMIGQVGRGITNRFRQGRQVHLHQPAQVAIRARPPREVTSPDAEQGRLTQAAPRAQRLAIASTSTQTAPQQPQITQSSFSDQGQLSLPAPKKTTGRGKSAHLMGGFQPRETHEFQRFQGEPPIGTPYTPPLPEGTVLVSLGLLGLLVRAGWASRRGIFALPVDVAEVALGLVTELHRLQLTKLDTKFNSSPSTPNLKARVNRIRTDLARVHDQVNQLRQHGHPVVKKALKINDQLNTVQFYEYDFAITFGVHHESVEKYRLQYLALCDKYRIAPLNPAENESRPEPMVTIPDQTPRGDTGNLERLLHAMQYNSRLETLKRKRVVQAGQELYLTSNGEEGIPFSTSSRVQGP